MNQSFKKWVGIRLLLGYHQQVKFAYPLIWLTWTRRWVVGT